MGVVGSLTDWSRGPDFSIAPRRAGRRGFAAPPHRGPPLWESGGDGKAARSGQHQRPAGSAPITAVPPRHLRRARAPDQRRRGSPARPAGPSPAPAFTPRPRATCVAPQRDSVGAHRANWSPTVPSDHRPRLGCDLGSVLASCFITDSTARHSRGRTALGSRFITASMVVVGRFRSYRVMLEGRRG